MITVYIIWASDLDITLKCGKSCIFYLNAYMYYPLWAVRSSLNKSTNLIQNRLGKKCFQRCQGNRMRICNNVLSINMSEKILFMHSAREINSCTSTSKKDNLIKIQCERKLIFGQGGKNKWTFVRMYSHHCFEYWLIKWDLNIHIFKSRRHLIVFVLFFCSRI